MFVEPRVEDEAVGTFLNLIQTDGYNPLELQPCTLVLDSGGREAVLDLVGEDAGLRELLSKPFTPGRVLKYIEDHRLKLPFEPAEHSRAAQRPPPGWRTLRTVRPSVNVDRLA